MTPEEFQKYVKERYEDQVNWYDRKSMQNQKMYKRFQWGIIILSAITPVLISIDLTRWPAVLISALVAIGTTSLKTFKYQENWINYRTTCETFKKEINYYKAKVGEYSDIDDPESLFVERVESLISLENTVWLSTQRPKTDKKGLKE